MQSDDWTAENRASYERARERIDKVITLLREAREELQPWAPPSAVNDLQAAQDVLAGFPGRLTARQRNELTLARAGRHAGEQGDTNYFHGCSVADTLPQVSMLLPRYGFLMAWSLLSQ